MDFVDRNLAPNEKPNFGQDLKSERLKFLRIGRIIRVDNEQGLVDIKWVDQHGEATRVPLTNAFGTLRGTISGMPEEGALVICGWIRQAQRLESPIILGYLDINLKDAIGYRLFRNKAPETLQELKTIREKIGWDSIRRKRRKLYPGEIQAESTQGAELYLDDNVYLSDNRLNEIEIVSADRSIRLSSRQQYHSTNATRIWNGMVTREPINGENLLQPTVLPNGKKVVIVTDSNNPYHLGGQALNEYRIESYEKSEGTLNVNGVNSGQEVNIVNPDVSFIMGTTVGNDRNDVQRYSKVLRPQVFGTPDANEPALDHLECLPEEYSELAGALQFRLHKSNTFLTFDKQGHLFSNIAASTSFHPLGEGRSWDANFAGSIKWVVGANTDKGRSIILDTKGGVKETLGYDSEKQRSLEIIAQKSVYTEVLAPDDDGRAWTLKTTGEAKVQVVGNYVVDVTGDYIITVGGKIHENILGTKVENYINDKNVVYGANFKELTIKHKEVSIGATRKVTIAGAETEFGAPPITPKMVSDELSVVNGSREETYTLGDLRRKLLLGDMTSELTLGDKDDHIIVGNRILTVDTGNIEEQITLGDHTEKIVTGNKTLDITTGNREVTISVGDSTEAITTGNKTLDITTGNREVTILTGDSTEAITTGNKTLDITTGNREVKIISGDSTESITTGNKELNITSGDETDTILTGSKETSITSGDISRSIVTGSEETSVTSGNIKESIVQGNRETSVTTGNLKETVQVGSKETSITTGDIKEKITAGNRETSIVAGNNSVKITTGNFTVDVTAGNIEVKTKVGKVDIQSATQTVNIQGLLKVTVKSGVKLEAVAPQVAIGQLPTKGGVVCGLPGVPTHLDYITGAPLIGSKTVKSAI